MKKIIFASSNTHKINEVKRLLKSYQILSLKDIGFKGEIVEDGFSFAENAMIKAEAVMKWAKKNLRFEYPVLADDSGLCVKAINYGPGINSARYSGKGDAENRKKLLLELLNIQDRTAYFHCSAVILMPSGESYLSNGKCFGLITKSEIGDTSFGYDCLFWSEKLRKTFGQATSEEKDKISHRALAMEEIKKYLDSINFNQYDDEDEGFN